MIEVHNIRRKGAAAVGARIHLDFKNNRPDPLILGLLFHATHVPVCGSMISGSILGPPAVTTLRASWRKRIHWQILITDPASLHGLAPRDTRRAPGFSDCAAIRCSNYRILFPFRQLRSRHDLPVAGILGDREPGHSFKRACCRGSRSQGDARHHRCARSASAAPLAAGPR